MIPIPSTVSHPLSPWPSVPFAKRLGWGLLVVFDNIAPYMCAASSITQILALLEHMEDRARGDEYDPPPAAGYYHDSIGSVCFAFYSSSRPVPGKQIAGMLYLLWELVLHFGFAEIFAYVFDGDVKVGAFYLGLTSPAITIGPSAEQCTKVTQTKADV